MKISIALPNTAEPARRETILGFAKAADQGGLHAVWVIDRVVFPIVESLATLAAAGGATERVRLGTAVLLGPTHDPVQLAAQVASIDVLSGGRMVLGLGVGSRAEDYMATGRDFHTRGRQLTEQVKLMRRIWAGEPVVEGFGRVGPPPVQASIPLLFGGSSDRAMARGAEYGDGYVCVPRGQARHVEMFEKFAGLWQQAGRSGKPWQVAQGYFAVADSPEQGREHIAEYQAHYYGTRPRASGGTGGAAEQDLVGGPEQIAEVLAGYARTGADEIILIPAVADVRQVELLAGPVMDAYRASNNA